MQIRKKGLNQLENFFFTNIFKNIIWHLFVGASHQVVKIKVDSPFNQLFLYLQSGEEENYPEESIRLPDGNMIVMGREKFLAPEILFQVLAAGQSKDGNSLPGTGSKANQRRL